MKKSSVTILILIGVMALAYFLIAKPFSPIDVKTSEEIAKCIGKNSVVYVQLGCPHCENQKKMFGDNYKYINSIDCFYKREECSQAEISATPTWVIKNKKYPGVQEIEKLRELTGC